MSGDRPLPENFEPEGESGPPEFDETLAQTYVGRTIIVGLTYLDHTGNLLEQRQLHGRITSANFEGIMIALGGKHSGQTWNMPPMLESIQRASPGQYRFRETGEVITDPDLMATWTITEPQRH
jgi:hypothetical protein